MAGSTGTTGSLPARQSSQVGTAESVAPVGQTAGSSSAGIVSIQLESKGGQKFLAPGIPYDVFPELPDAATLIASAGTGTPVPAGGSSTAGVSDGSSMPAAETRIAGNTPSAELATASTTANTTRPPVTISPATAGSTSPDSMAAAIPGMSSTDNATASSDELPTEILLNELGAARNEVGQNLNTLASYNSSLEKVELDAWELSALATLAAEHSGKISWKDNALKARDAAVAIAMAATGKGRENLKKADVAYQQFSGVINNNPPPDLAAPDPQQSREETADRASLMKRMQTAQERLKEAAASDSAFKTNQQRSIHEALILGTLTRFTAHGSYGSASEGEYQKFAAALGAAAGEMAVAAEQEDADGFKSALDRVETNCAGCHAKFRFAN